MARSDANGKEPTIDEMNATEMASFKGLTTTDGEVSNGEATPEEKAALARMNAQDDKVKEDGKEKPAADAEQETPEEKTAREAREAKMTDKQKSAAALQQKVGGKKPQRSADDRVKQINEATREMRQAQRDLAEARAAKDTGEIATLKAQIAELQTRLTGDGKTVKQADPNAPREQDYELGAFDPAYIRDVTVYETHKAIAAEGQKQTATAQTEQQRRDAQILKAKAESFGTAGDELYDDFAEVVVQGAEQGQWPLTKTFGDLMLDSENGPHIAYYLATHVSEAKRIMGLSPTAQAAAFGRLEATFSSTSSDATQQDNGQHQQSGQDSEQQARQPAKGNTTKVPPPPAHQARGAGGKTQVGADTTDFAAFERLAATPQ